MRVPTRKAVLSTAAVAALATSLTVGPSLAFGAGGTAAPTASATSSTSLAVVGLGSNGTRLVSFRTDTPGSSRTIAQVTGLRRDTRLVGIDYRVQDGGLYGVGEKGGIYRVNDRTGAATRTSNPAVPLDGSLYFGVDFNPAADALRIISGRGQNLRVPFAVAGSEAVVDGALTRPVVPATTPPSTEKAMRLTAAAYTNNDLDATTGTTLFDLDTQRDQVTIQSPANSGSTAATGALGFDAPTNTGMDIYSELRQDGRTVDLLPYAVSGGKFYRVNLLTGAATSVGTLGDRTVSDLALPLDQ